MERRHFLKGMGTAWLIFSGMSSLAQPVPDKKKRRLRFVVGSDSHYGQPNTPYRDHMNAAIDQMKAIHAKDPFDFGVINGDIIHDDFTFTPEARQLLDTLPFTYHVTQGNHDMATAQQWENGWNRPVNYSVKLDDVVLLFATTSNEKGTYLPPDLNWLQQQFQQHASAKHILLFIHIPPIKFTNNAIESKAFVELVGDQANLRAVFHGHEHDKDSIYWYKNIPFIFDGHIGGSWGVPYRGFRIVELQMDGALLTWIMDPIKKINNEILPAPDAEK
jgi:hypothetical protein